MSFLSWLSTLVRNLSLPSGSAVVAKVVPVDGKEEVQGESAGLAFAVDVGPERLEGTVAGVRNLMVHPGDVQVRCC